MKPIACVQYPHFLLRQYKNFLDASKIQGKVEMTKFRWLADWLTAFLGIHLIFNLVNVNVDIDRA